MSFMASRESLPTMKALLSNICFLEFDKNLNKGMMKKSLMISAKLDKNKLKGGIATALGQDWRTASMKMVRQTP